MCVHVCVRALICVSVSMLVWGCFSAADSWKLSLTNPLMNQHSSDKTASIKLQYGRGSKRSGPSAIVPSHPPSFLPSYSFHLHFIPPSIPLIAGLISNFLPSTLLPPLSDLPFYSLPWFPVWSLLHSTFIPLPRPPVSFHVSFCLCSSFLRLPFLFFISSSNVLQLISPFSIPPRQPHGFLARSHLSEFPLTNSFLPWSLIPWFNHTSPIPWLSPYSMTTTSPLLLHKCSLFFPLYLHHRAASFIYFLAGIELLEIFVLPEAKTQVRHYYTNSNDILSSSKKRKKTPNPTVLLVIHTPLFLLCSINLAQSRPRWTVIITLIKKTLWAVCIKWPACLQLSVCLRLWLSTSFVLLFRLVYSTVAEAQIPSSSQRKHWRQHGLVKPH